MATNDEGSTKATTVYEAITMTDGRVVQFPGKRQMQKEVITAADGQSVKVRFDLRSGDTFTIDSSALPSETVVQALGHGLSQKVGDTTAGTPKVEDMALAVEDMIQRLTKGEWAVAREAGDGFSGAGIVIKALCEVTGKSVAEVKTFINNKLEAAKTAGEKLSRKDIYDSLRNPASKVGQAIKRMEDEERSKTAKLSADDLIAEIGA